MINLGSGAEGGVERAHFGRLPSGQDVEVWTLRNRRGMEVRAIGYGAAITSLRVPDREGRFDDVVLGYDDLGGYIADDAYFGAVIGRFANRIRAGRFSLDGRTYQLATNNGPNHLHGGPGGFHKVPWKVDTRSGSDGPGIAFSYQSPDGEEGYPGTLNVRITYRLTQQNELVVDYRATTDQSTPINLTQHSYFNLTGDPERNILGHELELNAGAFTPVDDTLIPTGEIASVSGTPFDFRQPAPIGAHIVENDVQLARAGGYDHNYVLFAGAGDLTFAARVYEPTSGRSLEVHTTEPGIQFYSGNFLDGSIRGKRGVQYGYRTGFCLETQHFPDSPNQPAFPATILQPGDAFTSRTVYRFGTS